MLCTKRAALPEQVVIRNTGTRILTIRGSFNKGRELQLVLSTLTIIRDAYIK